MPGSITFVDANVIYDAVTDENSEGNAFFKKFRVESRELVTSTHAIGEVVKILYADAKEKKNFQIEKAIEAFKLLFDLTNIRIVNVSEKTFELTKAVKEEDTRIQFKDAIHVAVAAENGCTKFVTFDTGFARFTLKKFGLRLDTLGMPA